MKHLHALPADIAKEIAFVLCDLDDTLTTAGKLPAASYAGLEHLSQNGRKIVVVTGRPAGWCDMIARFWPVEGVVGENGAFYFRYLAGENRMVRNFLFDEKNRAADRAVLARHFAKLRNSYPGLALASDQAFRVSDIAIDICEDVEPLSKETVNDIVARLRKMGATVKVSSIHINAWIGAFDKLSMITKFLRSEFGVSKADAKRRSLYVGDSPNDEPMFGFFEHSVGVRNIENFAAEMSKLPQYITRAEGGQGFLEVARALTHGAATAKSGPLTPLRERNRRLSLPRRR